MSTGCRLKLLVLIALVVILHVVHAYAERPTLSEIGEDDLLVPWYFRSEEECEPLPSSPPDEDEPELDLLYLLTRGSEFLQNYTDTVDATLLLGNTGSGKSTLAQIIAGDLSKLHAVVAPGDQLVIIDDDNRIGLPSIKSKTLIPELIIKNENDSSLALYDCPGFDDTRGPVQDIAANFFMNQVSGRITNIKMLFLVIYSSVKLGNDRVDFDKLAKHATSFVKNIGKYTQSIGLLVTKVDSYNNRGQYIEDHVVIEQIVGFLKTYNETLHSSLGSGGNEDDGVISKKIIFVESLLEQELVTGNYSKIWFVRSPLECGPLSNMQMILDMKSNITQLYEQLVSTEVDPEIDFGFTLKDSSLLNISNYTATINTDIANATNIVTIDLKKQYFQLKVDQKIEDLYLELLLNQMRNSSSELSTTIEDLRENTSSIIDFLDNLNKIWILLDDILPNKFDNHIRWQDEYLLFFDKVTNTKQERLFKVWAEPLIKFGETYTHHMAWYEFCLQLELKTASYEFHSQAFDPPSNINPDNWLDYIITMDIIYVSDQIGDAYKSMRKLDVHILDTIMSFALKKPDMICLASQKALAFHSNFLRIQDISQDIMSCGSDVTRLEIYASHTIFIDANLTLYDMDLVMIAPLLQNPGQYQNNLLLAGSSALQWDNREFGKNQNSSVILFRDIVPEDGIPGRAGRPGNPGGTAFVILDSVGSTFPILFTSMGGDGGNGESGGNGASHDENCNNIECHLCLGGNGGDGGMTGSGGHFSEVTIVKLKEESNVLSKTLKGRDGLPGFGGEGGVGGGYKCYEEMCRFCSCRNFYCDNDFDCKYDGCRGDIGTSEEGLINPAPPKALTEYFFLIYYKIQFYSHTNTQTVNFFRTMDTGEHLKPFSHLKALAEESLALEMIDKTTANRNRLADIFFSLTSRLTTFENEHYNSLTNEHKKILRMLQSSSYSSYIRLRSPSTMPVITDVSFYFNIVKQQIVSINQAAAYNVILNEKDKFKNEITVKISQATNLIETTVDAAINQTGNEIEVMMISVEESLVNLILDAQKSLEECKNELQRAETRQGFLKFLKITEFITKIASAVLPGGKAWSQVSTMLSKLGNQFAGQPNELERLREMTKEIEKIVRDLDEKQEKFEEDFVPFVESFFAYLRNVSESLESGTEIAAPDLAVAKWQVTSKLKECKSFLEDLAESSINTKPLKNAFDRIQDSFLLSIELYEMIDRYLDTINLANYISSLHSAELYPEPIQDSDLAHTVAQFELTVKRNLFDQEAQKAMHAFKQWVFPFAKFYYLKWTSSETGDEQMREVERLEFQLDKYKAHIVGEHDTFIIQMNFTSGLKTSKPFFIWENEKWDEEIKSLFSGSKVHLNADVRLHGLSGWEAIKFKLIEINFRLNKVTSEVQAEFDDLIEYFGISMTHSGVSYYRFQEEYFVMTGANQTLLYNFEVDANGNRLGTNQVYEKFKSGDCMLSPYTLWTVQLLNVVPVRKLEKGNVFRDDVSYESLKKFLPYISVELVGLGTYVKGEEALAAAGGELQLEEWYERDNTMRTEYKF